MELAGQKFNKLTVIRYDHSDGKRGGVVWLCKCECGNETFATSHSLVTGKKKSCGCLNEKRYDLTGQVFGLLTVIEKVSGNERKKLEKWLCQCKCGNTCTVSREALLYQGKISCGCMKGRSYRQSLTSSPYKKTKSKKQRKKESTENRKSIIEITKAAAAAGMSYGQYVAQMK